MPVENSRHQSDLIDSLAATIQKKILIPASGKIETLEVEITDLNRMFNELQKEHTLLNEAHNKTRVLAVVSTLATAILGIVLIIVAF
jgi:PBP1b-binding outer membrane lipoprotein LpoB